MTRSRWTLIVLLGLCAMGAIAWAVHRFAPTPAWEMGGARVDDPARDAMAHTRLIEDALELRPGLVVADIGAGAGYFAVRFARAVGPRGRVIATDYDAAMITFMEELREARNVSNLEPRLVEPADPGLGTASVDRIAIVNALSFAECGEIDPRRYFRALRAALRPGGHVVVFRDERHTMQWSPPYGRRLQCDEPSAERIVELARPSFRTRSLRELPYDARRPGVAAGFLIVLEPQ